MHRRHLLRGLAALSLSPILGRLAACAERPTMSTNPTSPQPAPTSRLPSLFVAHGAPPLLDDIAWKAELATWAASLPRPRAILVLSAHWVAAPATIGATSTIPLMYDFYGFPQRYYEVRYPSPGAPELAARLRGLLQQAGLGVADEPTRGLDHGVFVPLLAMYPEANIPVLQVSLPTLDPAALVRLGALLTPLRDEGVLIMGSGFLTHNLRLGLSSPQTPAWASDFDAWVGEAITRHDLDALIDFRRKGPAASTAHPTIEHFVPVLVTLSAGGAEERHAFPISGFWYGSFTKRSVQVG